MQQLGYTYCNCSLLWISSNHFDGNSWGNKCCNSFFHTSSRRINDSYQAKEGQLSQFRTRSQGKNLGNSKIQNHKVLVVKALNLADNKSHMAIMSLVVTAYYLQFQFTAYQHIMLQWFGYRIAFKLIKFNWKE